VPIFFPCLGAPPPTVVAQAQAAAPAPPAPKAAPAVKTAPPANATPPANAAPSSSATPPANAAIPAAADVTKRALARLSVGALATAPSEHREALRADGYELGTAVMLQADVGFLLGRHMAVGVFGAYSGGGAGQTSRDSPDLSRHNAFVGLEAPILWQEGSALFAITPRAGAGYGWLHYGEGSAQRAFAYGADASVMLARTAFVVGLSAGVLWAPASPPGELGRPYNFGGLYLALTVGHYDLRPTKATALAPALRRRPRGGVHRG
jgi:hypothetical protein